MSLALILAINFIYPVTYTYLNWVSYRAGMRVKSSIMSLIVDKILRVSTLNSTKYNEGTLLNYIQVDIDRVEHCLNQLVSVISNSNSIVLGLIMIYYFLGIVVFYILLATIFMNLFYVLIYIWRSRVATRLLTAKDLRFNYLKSVLKNLEYVKLAALENYYWKQINIARAKEVYELVMNSFVAACGFFIEWLTPGITQLSIFIYFSNKSSSDFDFAKFTGFLQVYEVLKTQTLYLNVVLNRFVEMNVSIGRIDEFLNSDDKDFRFLEILGENSVNVVEMVNGNFEWLEKQKIDKKQTAADKKLLQAIELKSLMQQKKTKETSDDYFKLKNLNFNIKRGETIFIIGKSNAGKSSLLYSILGEMMCSSEFGTDRKVVKRTDKVSFVSQTPFTFMGTFKENIYMGRNQSGDSKKQDPNKPDINQEQVSKNDKELSLDDCLQISCLQDDLKIMPLKLKTPISDTSQTISGGQKTRMSLARSLYQQSELYLLDDFLSALDPKVARKVLTHMRNLEKSGKSLVISINNLSLIEDNDRVIWLENGEISYDGQWQNCKIKEENLGFHVEVEKKKPSKKKNDASDISSDDYLQKKLTKSNKNLAKTRKIEHPDIDTKEESDEKNKNKKEVLDNSKNIQKKEEVAQRESVSSTSENGDTFFVSEDRNTGVITCSTINRMVEAYGGWLLFIFIILMTAFAFLIVVVFTLKSVSWADKFKKGEETKTLEKEILIMSAIAAVVTAIRAIIYYVKGAHMSRNIHRKMAFKVLHTPLIELLQRMPFGQLLNRFSYDIDIVDKRIPLLIGYTLMLFFLVLVDIAAVLLGVQDFWLLIPCAIFLIVGHCIRLAYMKAKREMMRLYSISKSPISGLTESIIKGSPLIRALGREKYFSNKMMSHIEDSNKNGYAVFGLDIWFQQLMQILAWVVVLIPAYSYLIYKFHNLKPNNDFKYENLVFFVLKTSSLANDYTSFQRDFAELENSMIALERCQGFEELKSEAAYQKLPYSEKGFKISKFQDIDRDIQYKEELFKYGQINVDNVTAYYPGSESSKKPVLRNVTMEIKSGEKIGVVGRTGAGKSSFIKLFSRLLVPKSGTIKIDGIDISKLDLKHLRNQIMVISQNCALFEDSLRNNINPYMKDKKKEEELLKMMQDMGLDNQEFLEKGLDMHVEIDGSNLSQGQRQVISFIRAVERNRKIIILDEATANIDVETERLFQKAVTDHFKNSTMMIIAHRIQTVMTCDKICVFDQGTIIEYDTPKNLLKKKDGVFKELCQEL